MDNHKYTCRCGKRVDRLTSFFKNDIRVTLCDNCAKDIGFIDNEEVVKVDYDKVKGSSKEDNLYHMIDTREKK